MSSDNLMTHRPERKALLNKVFAWPSIDEKIMLLDGLIDGSGHQLWSAAVLLNVCFRAGLVV